MTRPPRTCAAIWLLPALLSALALALPGVASAAGTGVISGTVTAEGAGPLAGVQVCAEGFEEFECAETAIDGTYKITGLSVDEYKVAFYPGEGNFVIQYYDGATSWKDATPIPLAMGATETGIDAVLERGATMSGVVTAAATGLPVADVEVCAFATGETGSGGCAETSGSGAYKIEGLAAAQYEVWFSAEGIGQNLLSQPYGLGLVTVASRAELVGINAALQSGGQITGTVRTAATGAPLAGVTVCLTEASSTYPLACLTSPRSGGYRFTGVWTGSFKVVFSPEASELEGGEYWEILPDAYPSKWWNGQPSFAAATAIAITAPAIATGIDGSLGAPPAPPTTATTTPAPAPTKAVAKPKKKAVPKCRHGLVKRKIKGKTRCVRRHRHVKHDRKHAKSHKTPVHKHSA